MLRDSRAVYPTLTLHTLRQIIVVLAEDITAMLLNIINISRSHFAFPLVDVYTRVRSCCTHATAVTFRVCYIVDVFLGSRAEITSYEIKQVFCWLYRLSSYIFIEDCSKTTRIFNSDFLCFFDIIAYQRTKSTCTSGHTTLWPVAYSKAKLRADRCTWISYQMNYL